jgi:hypothetical protein
LTDDWPMRGRFRASTASTSRHEFVTADRVFARDPPAAASTVKNCRYWSFLQ